MSITILRKFRSYINESWDYSSHCHKIALQFVCRLLKRLQQQDYLLQYFHLHCCGLPMLLYTSKFTLQRWVFLKRFHQLRNHEILRVPARCVLVRQTHFYSLIYFFCIKNRFPDVTDNTADTLNGVYRLTLKEE